MRAVDIILKKRGVSAGKGDALSKEEIEFFIKGYSEGTISDYQMSALLMAIFFSGMTFDETAYLTSCMLHSGSVIDLRKKGLVGPFVDKHSTGGVGDKISLPLAPLVASLGVQVPMMSGRGLGHTGGTLDKLESIKGYNVNLTAEEFSNTIEKTGFAMMGQTSDIVPADRKMYALRDVTATVESIPLITASILSKKIAEGSDSLVFDVKFGRGAFMKSQEDAESLALSLVNTAKSMGKTSCALLTNMDSPLGLKTGNWLEIEETLDCLQGKGPEDVMELTYALGSRMAVFGGVAKTIEEGKEKCIKALEGGKALEKFLENIRTQGGDPDKVLSDNGKRRSPFESEIIAEKDGFLDIDAFKTGIACVNLGVGRNKTTDTVDADSGIILEKRQGEVVKKGEKIMSVFAKSEKTLEDGKESLREAIGILSEKPIEQKLILKEIK